MSDVPFSPIRQEKTNTSAADISNTEPLTPCRLINSSAGKTERYKEFPTALQVRRIEKQKTLW